MRNNKNIIKHKYDFMVLFDVENGNPNGDPDGGGMPRIDPETGIGLVTDVCLKRKIRNYVEMVKEDADGYRIYVKENVPLNVSDKKRHYCFRLYLAPNCKDTVESVTLVYENIVIN